MGTDYKGNQYWEKPAADAGMNRFVVYRNIQVSQHLHLCDWRLQSAQGWVLMVIG